MPISCMQLGSLPIDYATEGGYKDAIKLLENAAKVGGRLGSSCLQLSHGCLFDFHVTIFMAGELSSEVAV